MDANYKLYIDDFNKRYDEKESTKENVADTSIYVPNNTTNVVTKEKLREIQGNTLRETKDFLSNTFGPMGSNTKIVTGTNYETINSAYSKDGLKVLKKIINSAPIEASIVQELIDITTHVEKEVGDGTTSTVILSSLIFDNLIKVQNKYNLPPFQLMRYFNEVVEKIKEYIMENGKKCTVDDIYNISMISTNGNKRVSENIKYIYDKFGFDVDLSVGVSNTEEDKTMEYDGFTVTEGYADPAFINVRENNTSEIHNARVYHFADPIDNMQMIAYFEAIINHNIYEPLANDELAIPTVICCPRISQDVDARLDKLSQTLYQYDAMGQSIAKPPILVITDLVASDEQIMEDIATLAGCKSIRKYIDPNTFKADQEAGLAPTNDNVYEFYGEVESVVANEKKTKFINPKHMLEDDTIYKSLIGFLETNIKEAKDTASAGEIGLLKKRLSALKANMVEYLVGGVTISERDSIKDLAEDAIKNCKSASLYGVGQAANFEGLLATLKYLSSEDDNSPVEKDIAECLLISYINILEILYRSVETDDSIIEDAIEFSIKNNKVINISNGYIDIDQINFCSTGSPVLCSIKLDVNILETVSKIISLMVTSNQCLLQSAAINNY